MISRVSKNENMYPAEAEKSTFHETKEVTSRLREPIKWRLIPYKTAKESGHQIQIEMNISWDQIDEMVGKDVPITHLIKNLIEVIEGPMKSKYLGVEVKHPE
jgi:hypothetical protein